MKKLLLLAISLLTAIGSYAENYTLSTPNNTLIIEATKGKAAKFRYYGTTASLEEAKALGKAMRYDAFHAFGHHAELPYAALVKFPDGDNAMDLVVEGVEQSKEGHITTLCITLKDTLHPFRLQLCYAAYDDCDVIKFSTRYINEGKKPVVLQRYMSASLPVLSKDCSLLSLHGENKNECNEIVEPLGFGTKILSSQEGNRTAFPTHSSFMLSLEGGMHENSGNVIAGTLAWIGNFAIEFVNAALPQRPTVIMAGINPSASDYTLDGGSSLKTPELILSYSNKGKGQASRTLHYWARHHHVLDGTKLREVLLNSWEGVHFDTTQANMESMATDIAALGGEMFVMDDGWFGDKYPRDNDKTSLGDWVVCRKKLPEGIGALVEMVHSKGIKFGIWIEPEMVNTKSELYEKHPEWVLRHPAIEPQTGRGGSQLLLDMTNPKVQDFVFGVVDKLMTEHPDIDYIKWDNNMSMLDASSQYLPMSRQSNLLVDFNLATLATLERIRAAHPKVIIQLCASGGIRLNYGFMPYFQEVWTSDMTDPLHRLKMQWGALDFYPSNILAAHVCSHNNKYTQRHTPLKFRFDVASMCRLGVEMVPATFTPAEREYAKRAIAEYKQIRPIVQQGDLYKLISPLEGSREYAALNYVNSDKSKAVVMIYRLLYTFGMPHRIVQLQGLDPERNYRIREVASEFENEKLAIEGKVISGRLLMEEGVVIPELTQRYKGNHPINELRESNDYRSVILELVAE
jgi:alpha-galactosidase